MEKEISDIEFSEYKGFSSAVKIALKPCEDSYTSVTPPQQLHVQRGEHESAE